MFKLGLGKTKEPEIKLPTFTGSWRKQGNSRKIFTSVSLSTLKPLTVWIITLWKTLKELGILDHLTCLLRNLYAGQKATVRTLYRKLTGSKLRKEYNKAVIVTLFI